MRKIQIFLLILIIIGIGLLLTQKSWVPKLVNYILSTEGTYAQNNTELAPGLKDGRQCYSYSHEATKAEPYSVNEFLDIEINGINVSGTKTGTQEGPDMTNGYGGSITGTIAGNTINALYNYTVEGSENTEEEIYQTSPTGLEKLRYPLIDKNGILKPDTTKKFNLLVYSRVECEASN